MHTPPGQRIRVYWLLPFLILATAFAHASTTVVVTNPSGGLTVPTQFGVAAYAYGSDTVRVLQIYLDGTKAREAVYPIHNRMNVLLNAAAGPHEIIVQALDANGAVLAKTPVYFTVTGAPLLADNTTALDDETAKWVPCQSPCGGGTNGSAPPVLAGGSGNPNEDGSAALFQTTSTVTAYDSFYWDLPHTAPSGSVDHYFKYEFDLYIESTYANAPQAIEFESQQTVNTYVYNMAWQVNYNGDSAHKTCAAVPSGGVLRVFDYKNQCWQAVNLSITPFVGNRWYHINEETHIDSHGTVWHDALSVTDKTTGITTRYDPSWFDSSTGAWTSVSHTPPNYSGRNNQYSNAVQLDVNKNANPYRVFLDEMRLTYVP